MCAFGLARVVLDERAHRMAERRPRGFVIGSLTQRLQYLIDSARGLAREDIFLGGEVTEERTARDSGDRADVVDGGLLVALVQEQIERHLGHLRPHGTPGEFTCTGTTLVLIRQSGHESMVLHSI